MKKTLITTLIVIILANTGCASFYNHSRVKNNMVREHILTNGSDEQLSMLRAGVSPVEAVKVRSTDDGAGVMVSFDLLNMSGIKQYFMTFKEAPLSSTAALLVDVGTAYLVVNEFTKDDNSNSSSSPTDTLDNGLGITITGDNNNINVTDIGAGASSSVNHDNSSSDDHTRKY